MTLNRVVKYVDNEIWPHVNEQEVSIHKYVLQDFGQCASGSWMSAASPSRQPIASVADMNRRAALFPRVASNGER